MTDHATSPLFSLSGLGYAYPNGNIALKGVDLEIRAGDRIALIGRNGAGKSTLVRHLNGILPVQQGDLLYAGKSIQAQDLKALRLKVGVLFQDPDNHLFCTTLYEDVAFGPMNQGIGGRQLHDLVTNSLSKVGLEDLAYKPAHKLSYGQKKRAAFAALLAMQPDVLILDEPTANLDPRQEKIFIDILDSYKGTLLIIDHDLLFLNAVCSRAAVLDQGMIRHDFTMRELTADQKTLRKFGLDFTFRFTCCGSHQHHPDNHHHHHHTHEHGGAIQHVGANTAVSPPLLEMQHYHYSYPDNTPGIQDINLLIHPGDSIALIGENGAGKSTLASCLLGISRGDGYLLHRGAVLTGQKLKSLHRTVGMVFQHSADQLFCPTCREEVAFGPVQHGLSRDIVEQRVTDALAMVGLTGYEERVPLDMSGGERKRLAIASVLAMKPELLILDEPTPSLDPAGEELLLSILQDLPQAKLLITHDLFFISRLTRRTVVVHQGRIVRDYSTEEFLKDDHLAALNGLDYTYKNSCITDSGQPV